MSLPLPAPRPGRSSSASNPPFRVVLPDLDHSDSTERRLPGPSGSPSAEPRLVLAEFPEPVSPVLPESPIPTPVGEGEPRGLVILEQVLGRRDAAGRPVTFARKLRHRLFGMALGLTIVSAAALVVGLVGDVDNQGLALRDEIENLGTSSVALPDLDEAPEIIQLSDRVRPTSGQRVSGTGRDRSDEMQAAETEAIESGERMPVWFEGGIIEDDEAELPADGNHP